MKRRHFVGVLAVASVCSTLFHGPALASEELKVLHREGLVHGFLVLRTTAGDAIADGDLIQAAHGDQVTTKLVFHFKDGSLRSETAVYSQRGVFRLLRDDVIQKGPSFKNPMATSIDTSTGRVTVRYTNDDGKEKTETQYLRLPSDLANGLLFTMLKNIRPGTPLTQVSLLAATPKLRVVKLVIVPRGEESFSVAGAERKATRYVVKVGIGGLAGMIAPLFGQQPPDIQVWILGGEAPAFVKSEGPLYLGGPVWRIELASPTWP